MNNTQRISASPPAIVFRPDRDDLGMPKDITSQADETEKRVEFPPLPLRRSFQKYDWKAHLEKEMGKYKEIHLTTRHVEKELERARKALEQKDKDWDDTVNGATEAREKLYTVNEEISRAEAEMVAALRRKEDAEERYAQMKTKIQLEADRLTYLHTILYNEVCSITKYLDEHC